MNGGKKQMYKILPKSCKYFMKGRQGSSGVVNEPSHDSIKNTELWMFQCDSTQNIQLVAVPVVGEELQSGSETNGIRPLTAVSFDLLDGGTFWSGEK